MPPSENEELLRYYWQELAYFRQMGARFARAYPRVAGRLELSDNECPDPHVERLIESFAFLTGRIQRNIDNDFPQIALQLLDLLYPHYLQPVPSFSIARFEVDADRGKMTSGYEIQKHTAVFTKSDHDGTQRLCRFRTCYPVRLWPAEVVEAELESRDNFAFLDADRYSQVASVLRIRIESRSDPLVELEMDKLRFFINADRRLASALYETIFSRVLGVMLVADGGSMREIPADGIRQVGFGLDEEALPYPSTSQPSYRLLQEYFAFPEKFYFFDLEGLDSLAGAEAQNHLDLVFLLSSSPSSPPEVGTPARTLNVGPENFLLGCTPIVNLFPKNTEPIRIDHRRAEYRLVPDIRNEKTTEIHSVLKVTGSSDEAGEPREYAPFYSFQHQTEVADKRAFWHSRRTPTIRPDMGGTDIQLSFVDLDFNARVPPSEAVHALTLCTNRDLAEKVPANGVLQCDEGGIPVSGIRCVTKPTPGITPPLGGAGLWRLVSHLSLNHLSLEEGEHGLAALREILRLYSAESESVEQQILGIRSLSQSKVVRRIGTEAWRGFCRGTEITLLFDLDNYEGTDAFLLGAVLDRFFALYSSTNHFTQLVMKSLQREGEWKRWLPMAGDKPLL